MTTTDLMDVAMMVAEARVHAQRHGWDTDATIRNVPLDAFTELAQHPFRLAGAWIGDVELCGVRVSLLMDDPRDVAAYDQSIARCSAIDADQLLAWMENQS